MNDQEKPIIEAIVKAALADGLTVSVFDGEDYQCKLTRDFDTAMKALGHCEEEHLEFHNNIGLTYVGTVFLCYGNEPDEVVYNTGWNTVYGSSQDRIEAIVQAGIPA